MKYRVLLFWIPALIVLYLSIQEIRSETDRTARDEPAVEGARRTSLLGAARAFESSALGFRITVGAAGRIEAIFGNEQALDRLAVHDVGFDDLLYVRGGNAAVPDTIRIDDHRGAMFALIEAAGHVRAHPFLESTQREFLFEEELKLGLSRGIAATARMSGFALIAADEEMLFELGHKFNLQDFWGRGSRVGSRETPLQV